MKIYKLYVPQADARHDVRRGSAIVGDEAEGMVTTHYEGGGASNVQTFEEKIHHAAGRRDQRYPTVAQRAWDATEVIEVGAVGYDEAMGHWIIKDITDLDALRAWVGPEQELVIGGSDALIIEQGGFLFAKMPVMEQAVLMATKTPLVDKCREAIAFRRRMMT